MDNKDMDNKHVFTAWDDTHSSLWGNQPIRLDHRLHQSALFSRDQLARLIETYPREHYSLVHTGARESRRLWREGEIGNLSGNQVIDAISRGRLWLNLRNVTGVDTRYRDVVDQMFEEIAAKVPGFTAPTHEAGILISSPDAQVYYHADMPGQGLIQIAGRKRVYLYPASAPFITPQQLEDIALFDVEVDMPYADWYDRHAIVFDLEPGQMLNWPLNAPHRVENLSTVNISMTVSYVNQDIRRAQMVHLANGLLRHRFGYQPKSRAIKGASFWSKAVLQKLLRNSAWVKKERSARRPIDFKLDAHQPGHILDLAA
ncbi:cupin-like domain-containing protein [Bradyrhizobium prioriisuperbiae]|uniref:cupin-like domain-containing protein n=1 Tax=Bradyrhizobium prioriisuperbiae TaxID=2854389 RepID=UPI0028EACA7C|nr:cupin-like domain-containing protein [Bradyrhizobium prioritasuperba]